MSAGAGAAGAGAAGAGAAGAGVGSCTGSGLGIHLGFEKRFAVFGGVSENGVISKSWLSVLEWSDSLDDLGVPPFQETSKFY